MTAHSASANAPYRIFAEFETSEESFGPFLDLCRYDARESRQEEPGCLDFTVLVPEGERNVIVLFEVYRDKAAFEAHRNTPHFIKFARGCADMHVITRTVRPLLGPEAATH
ncbi:antibiotic biosynthesis monooxygenase [Oecophyllibacter saccharovorans]|uniref:putative quinol monooxygenase n=1 Tax=Oecophyllibacter saccharovorans TaxID=2558360 RepID=UPI001144653E|nr:putative quinol monooxygenase [Oecophyllibacter saccharovorans]QDH15061.1 antibiotic biosynthesis monooxygenase [Oecophyllibacter saccharovorans]